MANEKLKAVVVGTGWGAIHARGFAESEHADLVAVWSRTDKPEAREVAAQHGVPLYTDYTKMLDEQNPDLVGVATLEAGHAKFTIEALQHGCHVYCEKVLSDNLTDAKAMVAEAAKQNRQLNVGYNYRYSTSCQYLSRLVKDGKLGQILFAQLRSFTWCVHHMTDYANTLLGRPARAVSVVEMDPVPGKPHISVPAHAFETFTYAAFTKKAYMVQYDAGATLQAAATDYAPVEEPAAMLIVQGTEGRAELDDLSGQVTIWNNGREGQIYKPSQIRDSIGLIENGVLAVKDFARAMAEGEPAPIPGQDGVDMIGLEEAIMRSSGTGQWETVHA